MATAELDLIAELEAPYARHTAEVAPQTAQAPPRKSLEDTISLGLFIYRRLKSHSQDWATAVESGGATFHWEDSAAYAKKFAWWLDASRKVMPAIQCFQQSQGGQAGVLAELDDFQAAIRDVSLMSLDTERTRKSIASLQSGQGVSFEQAIEQLRTQLR